MRPQAYGNNPFCYTWRKEANEYNEAAGAASIAGYLQPFDNESNCLLFIFRFLRKIDKKLSGKHNESDANGDYHIEIGQPQYHIPMMLSSEF